MTGSAASRPAGAPERQHHRARVDLTALAAFSSQGRRSALIAGLAPLLSSQACPALYRRLAAPNETAKRLHQMLMLR
jgi:hypothetical protein